MPDTGDVPPQTPAAAALQARFEQAVALHQQGRFADAERIYRDVLQRQPDHFDALHRLGILVMQTRREEQGVELIRRAIAANPNVAAAHSNLGKALLEMNRPAEALASCDRAIALAPNVAMAHNNRGNALLGLNRLADALTSYDRAISLEPGSAMAYSNRAKALLDLKRPEQALASCDQAIALQPNLAVAHSNRGNALLELMRPAEALASFDRAIVLEPNFAIAHNNRGNVLLELKRFEEALASLDRAVTLDPGFAIAHNNRGKALVKLKRYDQAFGAYEKAYALQPDLPGAEGDRLHVKMLGCDWSNYDFECAHLIASVRAGNANTPPFVFLSIPSSSADQLQCAKLWVANKFPAAEPPMWQGARYDHDRIRIAFMSPDFREHALSYLAAGMFECHDKSRFEITGIACGLEDKSEIRQRVKAGFDRFIDARTCDDARIANLIKEREIDILVDLAGFTADARTAVFAMRPAPIQLNYLGYPCTMGAPYYDYMIADRTVIPDSQRACYSEKIVVLPNSYQVNDAKRAIAERAFRRTELGLPPRGFVFCCFNGNYKITPHVFDGWMKILKRVENSVLWLLEDNDKAPINLRREAVARGVKPERLIFAKRMALPEHLARQRLADLFLDTLPVNAHTTTSDALWAGLPVLTCLGETFAGRVAASLLTAIGLPELIATTLEDYERLAVDLAMQPEKLAAIKRQLGDNRLTAPLFDTQRSTRNIETAYTAMYERYQAGLAPDHIIIPN